MKKILIFALSAVCILSGQAAVTFIKAVPKDQDVPLWMRYPKISPDGSKIAFSYQGDIYYVPVSGGEAVRLTATDDYESQPIWSNDSRTIAFVSDRFGGMDIFTMSVDGGKATRVTTHSGTETPLAFSPDDKYIYFSAAIQDPASSAMWSASWLTELYRVKATGGRPEQITATPVCSISFDTPAARTSGASTTHPQWPATFSIMTQPTEATPRLHSIPARTATRYTPLKAGWCSSASATEAPSTSTRQQWTTLRT